MSIPYTFRSEGRTYMPQRYLIGWPDGIIKVGSTMNGRRRWGAFLSRGAVMLSLGLMLEDLESERWFKEYLASRYPGAFNSKDEACQHLPSGGGYLECFQASPADFSDLAEVGWDDTVSRGGINAIPYIGVGLQLFDENGGRLALV